MEANSMVNFGSRCCERSKDSVLWGMGSELCLLSRRLVTEVNQKRLPGGRALSEICRVNQAKPTHKFTILSER